MKKEKITICVTVFIMCVMLCSTIFMQFKTAKQTSLTDIKNMNEEELKKEVISWQNKYNQINAQLSETNEKIEKYEENSYNDKESYTLLNEEKEQTELLSRKNKC